MPDRDNYIDLPDLIKYLHSFGFSLRLTCVCCKGMMDTVDKIEEFISLQRTIKLNKLH